MPKPKFDSKPKGAIRFAYVSERNVTDAIEALNKDAPAGTEWKQETSTNRSRRHEGKVMVCLFPKK